MTQETPERPPEGDAHPCPEPDCDRRPAHFGALVSHLRTDHNVDPFEKYGGAHD